MWGGCLRDLTLDLQMDLIHLGQEVEMGVATLTVL